MDLLMSVVGSFWFWVVGVPVIAVAATDITKRVIRHRERMAMIQRGMDPDRLQAPATPPLEAAGRQPMH